VNRPPTIALAGEPAQPIASEPATALDVTVRAQILDLLRKLRQEVPMSILLSTHEPPDVAVAPGSTASCHFAGAALPKIH